MRVDEAGPSHTLINNWCQPIKICAHAHAPQAAEDASRRSLALKVQLGDVPGQANTLNQLGNIYDRTDRLEEAAAFYQQAGDRYLAVGDAAREGMARSNRASALRKLGRLDEARTEIERALVCKQAYGHGAEPWKTWTILSDIETDADHSAEAKQAQCEAVAAYLAYRRDGGENMDPDGRLCNELFERMQAGDAAGAHAALQQLEAQSSLPDWLKYAIPVFQAIVAGSRDPALAELPGLNYDTAAEVLWLMERLGPAGA